MADPNRQYLDDIPQEIQDFLYAGQKIEAIKKARELFGWELKQAKEQVELAEEKMREAFPQAMPSPRSGCAAVFMLAALLASVGCLWFWSRG